MPRPTNSPEISISATPPTDPRLGSFITSSFDDVKEGSPVLIGFPSDEGVRRNGGRAGAAQGPAAIRAELIKLAPDPRAFDRHLTTLSRMVDLRDVEISGYLEDDQEALGELVNRVLARGGIPIVLGGGHETAFGHYVGHALGGNAPGIVNWDAHADVRPLKEGRAHSGSPFRQAIQHPQFPCRRYLVAGLQPASVARDHLAFVEAHAGRAWFAEEVDDDLIDRIYNLAEFDTMVTFDLDAVAQADAPGVSAPAVAGLAVRHWLRAARLAGETRSVRSFDICELNPRLDVDGRTARLAARTVWEFVRGLADRE